MDREEWDFFLKKIFSFVKKPLKKLRPTGQASPEEIALFLLAGGTIAAQLRFSNAALGVTSPLSGQSQPPPILGFSPNRP